MISAEAVEWAVALFERYGVECCNYSPCEHMLALAAEVDGGD